MSDGPDPPAVDLDAIDVEPRRRTDALRRGARRLLGDRLAVVGLLGLALVVTVAVAGPLLAPHGADWTAPGDGQIVERDGEFVEVGVVHPAPPAFGDLTGDAYLAPLGTDAVGHGVLSRLLHGAPAALGIALAAGVLSTLVGVPLGLVSGFYAGSWVDEGVSRLVDVALAVPLVPLVAVLVTATGGVTTTLVVLAIVGKAWLNNAVVVRGEVLSLREERYVDAARVAGASDARILARHVLPNVAPLAVIYLAQDAALAVLIQANLAVIGLADPGTLSWGTMLQAVGAAGARYVVTAPWWALPPAAMITLLAASFYLLAYGVEDVADPHRR